MFLNGRTTMPELSGKSTDEKIRLLYDMLSGLMSDLRYILGRLVETEEENEAGAEGAENSN